MIVRSSDFTFESYFNSRIQGCFSSLKHSSFCSLYRELITNPVNTADASLAWNEGNPRHAFIFDPPNRENRASIIAPRITAESLLFHEKVSRTSMYTLCYFQVHKQGVDLPILQSSETFLFIDLAIPEVSRVFAVSNDIYKEALLRARTTYTSYRNITLDRFHILMRSRTIDYGARFS